MKSWCCPDKVWDLFADQRVEHALGVMRVNVTSLEDFLNASLARRGEDRLRALSPLEAEAMDFLAAEMDDALAHCVHEMEAAARCQQEERRAQGLQPLPPFAAFCQGIESIAAAVIPSLFERFYGLCATRKLEPATVMDVMVVRAEALTGYLVQLAQVHGLAGEGAPLAVGESERLALEALRRGLAQIIAQEMDGVR